MKAKFLVMLAGIAMLAACKGEMKEEAMKSILADQNVDSAKLVKTADMRLKVKNVQQAAEWIAGFVRANDGVVMHHTMKSDVVGKRDILLGNDSVKKLTVYNTNTDMTVKVPSDLLGPFMDSVNHLSTYVDERKMDIEDRTIDYMAEELKARNRQQSIKLRSKIKLSYGGADSILALNDNVVDRKIANLRTRDAVDFSTLTLNLYQNNVVQADIVANDDLGAYNIPLFTRAGIALSNGWDMFSQLVLALLNLWPFAIAAAGCYVGFIAYKRRKATTTQIPS